MPDIQQDQPAVPSPEQLGSLAQSGPQPVPPAMIAGAPPAAAPAAPAPSPQQVAQQTDTQHHSALGKLAAMLLGRETTYAPDPVTGEPRPQPVQRKPGELFRQMLAGAVLGMAAGSGTNSPLAGFARGGTAAMQANMNAAQQQRAQAQQQFENKQATDREQRAQQMATAQNEVWNMEQLGRERDHNLREREFIENGNERQAQLAKWAQESGGIEAPITADAQTGNGKDLMAQFTSDPQKFRAPQGYDRFLTHDVDTSGLQYDSAKGWTDSDGNPVDLAAHTTWHVYYVPQKPQPVTITGKDLNKIFPQSTGGLAAPDKTYSLPWSSIIALGTQEHSQERKDDDLRLKQQREARIAATSKRDQNRKDVDQGRKNKLADQKLNSANAGKLQFIHVNPQTKQSIGWNGSSWVDATTGTPVQGQ